MTRRTRRKFEKCMDYECDMIRVDASDIKDGTLSEPNDIIFTIFTLANVAVSAADVIHARNDADCSYRETYKTVCLRLRDAIMNVKTFYRKYFPHGGYYGAPRLAFESMFSMAEAMPCDVKSWDEFDDQCYRIFGSIRALMMYVYDPKYHLKYDVKNGDSIWEEDGETPFHRYWESRAANCFIDEHALATGLFISHEMFDLDLGPMVIHYVEGEPDSDHPVDPMGTADLPID